MVSPEGTGSGLSAMASARDGAAQPEAAPATKPAASLSKVSPQSPTPATPVSVSQALPKASPSALAWLALGVLGQLSEPSGTVSPSASGRQPESRPSVAPSPSLSKASPQAPMAARPA